MLKRMLRSRYYIGYVTWNGVEYKGRHPKLVSPELFERVQTLLDSQLPGKGSRQRRYHHYLKGLLWCNRCNRRLIVMRGKSHTGDYYFYYVCRGRQDKLCDLPYLRVVQAEAAVAQHYHTVTVFKEQAATLRALFDDTALTNQLDDQQHRARLLARLQELERQEDRFVDAIADPEYPKAKIHQQATDYP